MGSITVNRLFRDYKFEFPFGLSYFNLPEAISHLHPGEIYFDFKFDGPEIFGIIINIQGSVFFICLPTERSHRITRVGIPFNGNLYFPREAITSPSSDETKHILLWHPMEHHSRQFNSMEESVVRSIIKFDWNN